MDCENRVKNFPQSFIEFRLTIRRLADRQNVSEAGLEAGGQAYFLSLNLLGARKGATSKSFQPEHVLCSLRAVLDGWYAPPGHDLRERKRSDGSERIGPHERKQPQVVWLHYHREGRCSPKRGLPTQPSGNKERVFCSLSAAKRKRAKRPAVANVGVERKARPCSPQGQIHHAAKKRSHSDYDAVEISGNRTAWNRRDNPRQHSENKETIGPSNGREDRCADETYAACLRHGRTRLEHAGPKTPPTNEGQKENVLFSILARLRSIEDRGFLSSLSRLFLGTTHGHSETLGSPYRKVFSWGVGGSPSALVSWFLLRLLASLSDSASIQSSLSYAKSKTNLEL